MKSVRIILLSVFSLAICASAEPTTAPSVARSTAPSIAAAPSTQPSHAAPNGHDGLRLPRGDILRGNAGITSADSTQTNPATPEEIDATLKFVKENFPNHYSFFDKLPPNGPFRNKVALPKMVQRYRMLMRMQESNPEAYGSLMQQSKMQDEALGFARDLNSGSPNAESSLRDSISKMVDKSLTDRQERIMKLQRMLGDQQRNLERDQRNRDKMVDEQIDKTKKEAERLLKGKDPAATAETTDATTRPSDLSAPANGVQPVDALTTPAP